MINTAQKLQVSVVVCTYSIANYENLKDTLESLLNQTYLPEEIIAVVDGNQEIYRRLTADYPGRKSVKAVLLSNNVGISAARNAGIRAASGQIIAFIDDDAVADINWLKVLVDTYNSYDTVSAGGKIVPLWHGRIPSFFPQELYWLVGVTNYGFEDNKITEVRNTYGSNMSFRRSVFEKVGLFNRCFGFNGSLLTQAEEPDLTLRIKDYYNKNVIYNPEALVYHKIPVSKVTAGMLLNRSFYQGYSKALIRKLHPSAGTMQTENAYLRHLLFKRIPAGVLKIFSASEFQKILMLTGSILGVGLGYIYGMLVFGTRRRPLPVPGPGQTATTTMYSEAENAEHSKQ